MICSKCGLKEILKEKEKAMKRFTEKLKREKYNGSKNNDLSSNKPKK